MTAYGVFLTAALAVYHFIANGEFSAILTLAVIFQCLGFALLCVQVLLTGTCTGISARALALDAWALCFRLSSTLWLNGYLPVDASGDWAYQAVDIVSLVLVLWLLHSLLFEKKHTYQEEQDTFPATPVVLACLALAVAFHADMNSRPIFDTLWMAGLFISAVAVLPQLWLISKTGGKVEPLTSHYIAAMAISRALSGVFMWHARFDITCAPWVGGFNHAIWVILGAHALHMLLLGDFGYYYIKTVMKGGLTAQLDLIQELRQLSAFLSLFLKVGKNWKIFFVSSAKKARCVCDLTSSWAELGLDRSPRSYLYVLQAGSRNRQASRKLKKIPEVVRKANLDVALCWSEQAICTMLSTASLSMMAKKVDLFSIQPNTVRAMCFVNSVFLTAALAVYRFIANGEHVIFQCLGFALLCVQVLLTVWGAAHSDGSTEGTCTGISAWALALDVWLGLCAFACPPRPGPGVSREPDLLVVLMQLACSSIADFSASPDSLWLHGYLPVDASGDWAYQAATEEQKEEEGEEEDQGWRNVQAVDVVSLVLVLWLLHLGQINHRKKQSQYFRMRELLDFSQQRHSLFFEKKHTYQEEQDMNARPVFDTLWMAGAVLCVAGHCHAKSSVACTSGCGSHLFVAAGLFISAVAVLPQLWLISKTGGKVEPLTSHYIAAMAISRALSGVFMWHARFDITCDPWVPGYNHAIWVILGANALHMLLLGDFGYYYIKTVMKGGLTAQLDLIEELGLGFEDCTCDSHRSAGQLRLACCSESAASHRDTLCRHRQVRVFIILSCLPSKQEGWVTM
ncbi:kdelr1 [Symbiodinium necroappetens]|uniref:Kdelr1 protein n=1 Tax=Symbiodinium necroappetens TaxID=1628268 RepID=A0A812ZZM1_9DINO|nr:kdelr1 [Symbiodinium necroappetens]